MGESGFPVRFLQPLREWAPLCWCEVAEILEAHSSCSCSQCTQGTESSKRTFQSVFNIRFKALLLFLSFSEIYPGIIKLRIQVYLGLFVFVHESIHQLYLYMPLSLGFYRNSSWFIGVFLDKGLHTLFLFPSSARFVMPKGGSLGRGKSLYALVVVVPMIPGDEPGALHWNMFPPQAGWECPYSVRDSLSLRVSQNPWNPLTALRVEMLSAL